MAGSFHEEQHLCTFSNVWTITRVRFVSLERVEHFTWPGSADLACNWNRCLFRKTLSPYTRIFGHAIFGTLLSQSRPQPFGLLTRTNSRIYNSTKSLLWSFSCLCTNAPRRLLRYSQRSFSFLSLAVPRRCLLWWILARLAAQSKRIKGPCALCSPCRRLPGHYCIPSAKQRLLKPQKILWQDI